MKVKFSGGPMHGEIREEADPAPMILPKGTSMDALEMFLSGGPITCEYYKLYGIKNQPDLRVYIWTKPDPSKN